MRHRSDRETSSAVQRVDFDGSALINFFVGSASHRVDDGSSRHWVVSAVRRSVASTVCVGTASAVRRVDGLRRLCVASCRIASAYAGADDRLTSAAQRFVDKVKSIENFRFCSSKKSVLTFFVFWGHALLPSRH